MSPRGSDVRERMLDSTDTLIRQRGASATSLDNILAHSGAPRGSLYYYFPGGRTQLIEETVERAGASIEQLIASAGDHSPIEVFDGFVKAWRDDLIASSFQAGCPVLAVAIETQDETPQLTEAAARAFTSWRSALAALLRRHGASPAEARRLANLVIAAVEGAVALSRAEQSPQPLDDAARALRPLLQRTTAPHSKKP
ncbi:MAG TPA: TetR/AcrR family transcriptional regulator [Mycobacterium sp.]|nr:TetR/AcrR family transcriptional regulator [Mycobacterium sp.]HTX95953.1 TetR/AcrR family transcriptional regulator [Mycobacterium sp.]